MGTLQRFIDAQDNGFPTAYEIALSELKDGQKRSHWIWFVLPQLRCLGRSNIAIRYGIEDINEAKAYLQSQLLRDRLVGVLTIIEKQILADNKSLEQLMGKSIDAVKTISSLTLFEAAGLGEATPLLDQLGMRCETTQKELESMPQD